MSVDRPLDPGLNPFYVLELRPGATDGEIERAGQRLAAMLAVGLEAAKGYATPVGPRIRDEQLVRTALHELRDPRLRGVHAVFALLPAEELPAGRAATEGWPELLRALGVAAPG